MVVEYERETQQEDSGLKLGCDEDDLFDDGITDSQLERATNAPTQEENPEGLDQSPEVVEILPPVPMEGIESEQDSVPLRDGQDIVGLEDPILSPPSVEEIPLGQEDSRQEVEQDPTGLSLVIRISVSMLRRSGREPASWTPRTPSLVTAPNPRR